MNFKTVEHQLETVRAIFLGINQDQHGYCGCPVCGSRSLIHDGYALDDGYITCINCRYSISGSNPHEMVLRWNAIYRNSSQLKIVF